MSNSDAGPSGKRMTTEVRTNILTSCELLHCILGQFISYRDPRRIHSMIPLTQLMDFPCLKIRYVGAWKCQRRNLGSEIYREFIDHQMLLSAEKDGEGPRRRLVKMQPLYPMSPWARADIWTIYIYMYSHRSNQTSRCRHNSRIQSRISTTVSAVTDTHDP